LAPNALALIQTYVTTLPIKIITDPSAKKEISSSERIFFEI
jgi:hypothetical protein